MIKQQSSTDHFFEGHFYETATCGARRATFLERSFRVVPAVLVRAQVLRNNLGATFLPAEEITNDWAAEWNGVPVLVGPHPSIEGQASSGRTPELWNERGVGWIFNAHVDTREGVRRLLGEVWLDESRAAAVTGFQAVLDRLDAGQPVELSTGFATSLDEEPGVYNGQQYELVLHPSGADHLVISVDMTGACSVLHGCGLGANEEAKVAEDTKNGKATFFSKIAEMFGKRSKNEALSWENHELLRGERAIAEMQLYPSDDERRQLVREALQEKFGASDRDVIVCDIYSEGKVAIFWFSTPMGSMPKGSEYYKASWADDANGKPVFNGEYQLVRRQTVYEPIASNEDTPAENKTVTPPVVEAKSAEEQTKQLVDAVTNASAQVKAAAERIAALV